MAFVNIPAPPKVPPFRSPSNDRLGYRLGYRLGNGGESAICPGRNACGGSTPPGKASWAARTIPDDLVRATRDGGFGNLGGCADKKTSLI
jgi:hypothetical protein